MEELTNHPLVKQIFLQQQKQEQMIQNLLEMNSKLVETVNKQSIALMYLANRPVQNTSLNSDSFPLEVVVPKGEEESEPIIGNWDEIAKFEMAELGLINGSDQDS